VADVYQYNPLMGTLPDGSQYSVDDPLAVAAAQQRLLQQAQERQRAEQEAALQAQEQMFAEAQAAQAVQAAQSQAAQQPAAGSTPSTASSAPEFDWTGLKGQQGYADLDYTSKLEFIDETAKSVAAERKYTPQQTQEFKKLLLAHEKEAGLKAPETGVVRGSLAAVGEAGGRFVEGIGDTYDALQGLAGIDNGRSDLSRVGKGLGDAAFDASSPAMKDAVKRAQFLANAGRAGDLVDFVVSNPSVAAYYGVTSLAPLLVGGAELKGLQLGAKALGGAKLVEEGSAVAGLMNKIRGVGTAITESGTAGKWAGGAVKLASRTVASPINNVMGFNQFGSDLNQLSDQGVPITDDVRSEVAKKAALTAAIGGVFTHGGGTAESLVQRLLQGGLSREAAPLVADGLLDQAVKQGFIKRVAGRLGTGFVRVGGKEGFEEFLQESMGNYIDQTIQPDGTIDPDKVDYKKVVGFGTLGAVAGIGPGAIAANIEARADGKARNALLRADEEAKTAEAEDIATQTAQAAQAEQEAVQAQRDARLAINPIYHESPEEVLGRGAVVAAQKKVKDFIDPQFTEGSFDDRVRATINSYAAVEPSGGTLEAGEKKALKALQDYQTSLPAQAMEKVQTTVTTPGQIAALKRTVQEYNDLNTQIADLQTQAESDPMVTEQIAPLQERLAQIEDSFGATTPADMERIAARAEARLGTADERAAVNSLTQNPDQGMLNLESDLSALDAINAEQNPSFNTGYTPADSILNTTPAQERRDIRAALVTQRQARISDFMDQYAPENTTFRQQLDAVRTKLSVGDIGNSERTFGRLLTAMEAQAADGRTPNAAMLINMLDSARQTVASNDVTVALRIERQNALNQAYIAANGVLPVEAFSVGLNSPAARDVFATELTTQFDGQNAAEVRAQQTAAIKAATFATRQKANPLNADLTNQQRNADVNHLKTLQQALDASPLAVVAKDSIMLTEDHPMMTQLRKTTSLQKALRNLSAELQRRVGKGDARARVLNEIADNSESVKVEVTDQMPDGVAGQYDAATNTVKIHPRNAHPEHTLIHESVHAATVYAIRFENDLSKEAKQGLSDLRDLYNNPDVQAVLVNEVAATSLEEFVAEAIANPRIHDLLNSVRTVPNVLARNEPSKFRVFINAVMKLFDLKPGEYSAAADVFVNTRKLFKDSMFLRDVVGRTIDETFNLGKPLIKETQYLQGHRPGSKDAIGHAFRLEDGTWDAEWIDLDGNTQQQFFDTEEQVRQAFGMDGVRADVRGKAPTTGHPVQQVDAYTTVHPILKPLVRALRPFLKNETILDYLQWTQSFFNQFANGQEYLAQLDREMGIARQDNSLEAQVQNEVNRSKAALIHGGSMELSYADQINTMIKRANAQNVTAKELENYAHAMAAQERNNALRTGDTFDAVTMMDRTTFSGFSWTDPKTGKEVPDDDGSLYLRTLSEDQKAKLENIMQPVRTVMRNLADEELVQGIINQKKHAAYISRKFYLPLKNEGVHSALSQERATGRDTKADNPLAMAQKDMVARYQRIAKVKGWKKVVTVLRDSPSKTHFKLDPQKVEYDDDGEAIWRNLDARNEYSFTVPYPDGKSIRVTATSDLARKAVTRIDMNEFSHAMGKINRLFSAARTVWSPAFVAVQPVWDGLTTIMNAQGAVGLGTDGKYVIPDHEAKTFTMQVMKNSILGLPELGKKFTSGFGRGELTPMLRAFYAYGGSVNAVARQGFESFEKSLSQDITAGQGAVDVLLGNVSRGLGHAVDALHVTEDMYRYGIFKTLLERANNYKPFTSATSLESFIRSNPDVVAQAARAAKDITGNFELKGNNPYVRTMYAFFQASMTGMTRTLPMIFSSPHGRQMAFGLFMMAMLTAAAQSGGEDDSEGKENSLNNSKFFHTKGFGNQLIFGSIGLPIPPEFRPLVLAGMSAVGVAKGYITPSDAAVNVASTTFKSLTPITGSESDNFGAKLAYAIAPAALQWLPPIVTGEDYFGKSTAASYVKGPDGRPVNNPLDFESGRNQDSDTSKKLAELLYRYTGTDILPSTLDGAFAYVVGSNLQNYKNMNTARDEGANIAEAFGKTIFKRYGTEYDSFAIKDAADEVERDALARGRIAERNDDMDMLNGDPLAQAAMKISKQRAADAKQVKIDGMTRKDLYEKRDEALETGYEDSATYLEAEIEALQEQLIDADANALDQYDLLKGN
jgi:hypothetical protein